MTDPLMPFTPRPAASPPPAPPLSADDVADDNETLPRAYGSTKDLPAPNEPGLLRHFAPLFRSDCEPAHKGRLPASWRGEFEAAPGDSRFVPHDPGYFGLEAGQGIAYVHGVPDYKQGDLVARLPSGRPGVTHVPGLTGQGDAFDFDHAVRHLARTEGMTEPELRQWLLDNDIKLHRFGGSEIQSVNGRLHRAHRWGGAGPTGYHQHADGLPRPDGYDWKPDDS